MAVEIPAHMRHLVVQGGLPVPYMSAWDEQKCKYVFAVIDGRKIAEVIRLKLCSICGKPPWKYTAFVGDRERYAEKIFAQPPMCEPCARFALVNCPHLTGGWVRTDRSFAKDGIQHGVDGAPVPEQICLVLVRRYLPIHDPKYPKLPLYDLRRTTYVRVAWFAAGQEVNGDL